MALNSNAVENSIIVGTGKFDQETTLFLDNFVTYYFAELTSDFGDNEMGSCSYTAAATTSYFSRMMKKPNNLI